jgi:hypothetical protein
MDRSEDVLGAPKAGKTPSGPLGLNCSIETSNSSSFWRVRHSYWRTNPPRRVALDFSADQQQGEMLRPDKSGLSMTVSGRSRERRSIGPSLSTLRLGQPRADVLTSRIAVFRYERSARQGGRLPLETARMVPWVVS